MSLTNRWLINRLSISCFLVIASCSFGVAQENIAAQPDSVAKISTVNQDQLLAKGNSVFVEIPDDAARAGEKYFIDALKEWGFWNVAATKEEAQFIIQFNIVKKTVIDRAAYLVFKNKEGQEFLRSESYNASTNAFNGYNAFRACARKVVGKFLKRRFK